MKKYIPFDKEKAQAGAKVVDSTPEHNPVRIVCFDGKNTKYPIISDNPISFTVDGRFSLDFFSQSDLLLEVESTKRPLTAEEVMPLLGAWIKGDMWHPNERAMIIRVRPNCFHIDGNTFSFQEAMSCNIRYSIDNGKSWHPCWVEE